MPPRSPSPTPPLGSRNGSRFVLFETKFGACGLAFDDRAVTRVQFPEATREATIARLSAGGAVAWKKGPLPRFVQAAAQQIQRHLSGRPQDFSAVPLALEAFPPARRRIYEAARGIKPGETLTYEGLAERAGVVRGARAAGAAMAANPFILVVPCHRVLGANGALHGFSAHGGVLTKRRLLALEGVNVSLPRAPVPRRRDDYLEYDWKAALAHLRKADPALAPVIARLAGQKIEVQRLSDPFQSLARSIVYQQLSGKAAATILARVLALFPGSRFPTPAALLAMPEASMRGAGLSGSKTKALRDLAQKTIDGVVPSLRVLHRLRDEEIIERLTSVWGVGQWSVEMMLMFRLGRADVLPVDDLGVRKGFALVQGLPGLVAPTVLIAHGERWRPYRSVASWL
ncbi:MAG TPA: methylated-DNA--[protein]-cysteine S-methyltransferase, partial [Polyangia bacterium]